jgi:hypothetical protein
MSNGQACFQIEDRSPAENVDSRPPSSGVRDTESTIHVVDGRAAAVTVPGAGVDRFAATMPVVEEPLAAPPFEWCVDLGASMITKTTFELWTAIEQGEVRGHMLVWREGMECWTPVERVGELICALERAPTLVPAEPSTEPAEATTNPELRRPVSEPPRASSRRRVPVRGGGKWIALGSAVAASAISAAALTTLLAQPATAPSGMREAAAAAAPARQGVVVTRTAPAATPQDVPASTLSEPVTISASPPKARHEDRGQHRRRAGDRR